MGEGTAVLTHGNTGQTDGVPPRLHTAAIEQEIQGIRGELGQLIGELDRRRHEMLDVKLQVKRHAVPVSITAAALVAATAGAVAFGIIRARRRSTVGARAGRLRDAVSRMIDSPERVAVEPTITTRILGAAGSAAAAFLIRAVLQRLWESQLGPRDTTRTARHGMAPSPHAEW